ncbi:hypothetical protein CRUP_018817 [Coryphaenoides rupestris]|nr:hypothetical protein CRUP_018817 [Coryphaenoides rupestris]
MRSSSVRSLVALILLLILWPPRRADGTGGQRQCAEADYYYEYTECDSTGSRWRVAIPHSPGACDGLPEPVKGTACTFSCKAGEFLEMSAQECTRCAAGSYSLGSGIRFDQWDATPAGFSSLAAISSWVPQGSYMESNRDECMVSLIYAVHLKKQGSIQNDQCQEADQSNGKKWLKLTNHGEWTTHTVNLKSGSNVLYWRTGAKDYFQIHTACDSDGKTQVMYKWIEPKLCLDGAAGAVPLPANGEHEPCPPCNPGFFNNDTAPCPAGTEPILGYEYKWWNVLPANIKTSCFNVGNSKCDNMNGWEVAGDHIVSGAGGSDNDYLILNIHIPGFNSSSSSGTEFGRIVFEFETECSADCELYFMTDVNRKSTTVVESWTGSKARQTYTHVMTKNASSSECRPCALSSLPSGSLCVPCPPGHYIDPHNSQCIECPPNTHLVSGATMGPDTLCFSDCKFTHSDGNTTLSFDFGPMGSVGTLMNGPSFTSKGTKYFHQFNISLCGGEERMALCTDNVTDLSTGDGQQEKAEAANAVKTFICQSTIIPASGRGLHTALSSQSINLANTFLGVSVDNTLDGVHAQPELFAQSARKVPDVNFFYRRRRRASRGRSAVVTLRCRPQMNSEGQLTVPSGCPAGTCNGCTFHFLWESSAAWSHVHRNGLPSNRRGM